MKINSIVSIMKKSRSIQLFTASDGTQWVANIGAAYPLYGMPRLDEDSLRILMDLKEDGKHVILETEEPDAHCYMDSYDMERLLPPGLMSVGYRGQVLYPARTSLGLRFYDPVYLKPLEGDYELYERETEDGDVYLAAKKGLVLMALIFLPDVDEAGMANGLLTLHRELLARLSRNKYVTADGQRYMVAPDTGELVEVDE